MVSRGSREALHQTPMMLQESVPSCGVIFAKDVKYRHLAAAKYGNTVETPAPVIANPKPAKSSSAVRDTRASQHNGGREYHSAVMFEACFVFNNCLSVITYNYRETLGSRTAIRL